MTTTENQAVDPKALAAWRKGVADVIAKARRVDAATLGDTPETLLDTATYDGVTIHPLYSALDALPDIPLPGAFPFIRGVDAHRDSNSGWKVNEQVALTGTPAEMNRALINALENGASAITLSLPGSVSAEDLRTVLKGVLLDLVPVTVDAGADTETVAGMLLDLLAERSADPAVRQDDAAVSIKLGAAPLTSAFSGSPAATFDQVVALAARANLSAFAVRAITVDGTAFHNAGASHAQELGASIAAGVEYLRLLEGTLSTEQALGQLAFRFAATVDQFATIAKFRAGRVLWARVAEVLGFAAAGNAPQQAVTSLPMMTQRDPWVNMLRETLATFGAGIGGADEITVLPLNVLLPEGTFGITESFAARMARNTQLLLLEESHLGRVIDPGGGSWYIEQLTNDLAEQAWAFFQEIEVAGGYRAALDAGLIAEKIAAVREKRAKDVRNRKVAITGVNEFPNLDEPSLLDDDAAVYRYSIEFERLRSRSDAYLQKNGKRPAILLVPLGPIAEHNIRTTFTSNVLASGGIDAINPGTLTIDQIAGAVSEHGSTIAVVCGSDKRYGQDGAAAIQSLRKAGVAQVVLAGAPDALGDIPDTDKPDSSLTARMDARAALERLLDQLGA